MLTKATSLDNATRLQRGAAAAVIVAAHIGVLYGAVTLGPVFVSRPVNEAVIAHFVEAVAPQPRWQPPSANISTPPIDVREPLAPAIEVPVEIPVTSRQIVARTISAPPPQAATASAGEPKLISSVEYVRQPAPRYPPQSRRLKEQGLVVLRVLIDEKGQACSIEVESSSGYARLDHAAKDAVARAAFRPYVEDGEPRRALVLIPIEFSLNRGAV